MMKTPKKLALSALLLMSAGLMSFVLFAPIYFTSTSPGGANMDQLNLSVQGGGGVSWTIDKVQVWDGTGNCPTGDDWDATDNAAITEYPQTANDAPGSGEWKNVGTNAGKPKLWFGNDIPADGKVRICFSYENEPAINITQTGSGLGWVNHP